MAREAHVHQTRLSDDPEVNGAGMHPSSSGAGGKAGPEGGAAVLLSPGRCHWPAAPLGQHLPPLTRGLRALRPPGRDGATGRRRVRGRAPRPRCLPSPSSSRAPLTRSAFSVPHRARFSHRAASPCTAVLGAQAPSSPHLPSPLRIVNLQGRNPFPIPQMSGELKA